MSRRQKPTINMGDMIDDSDEPIPTGVPQRGAEPKAAQVPAPQAEAPAKRPSRLPPKVEQEKRTDVLSVRAKTSTRKKLEALCQKTGYTQAELVERAIDLLIEEAD